MEMLTVIKAGDFMEKRMSRYFKIWSGKGAKGLMLMKKRHILKEFLAFAREVNRSD